MSATRGDTTKTIEHCSQPFKQSNDHGSAPKHSRTLSVKRHKHVVALHKTSNSRFLLVIEGRETQFFSCSHDRSFCLLHAHDHYQFAVQTLTWNVMITKCCNLIGLHSRVQTVQLLGLFYTRPFLYMRRGGSPDYCSCTHMAGGWLVSQLHVSVGFLQTTLFTQSQFAYWYIIEGDAPRISDDKGFSA